MEDEMGLWDHSAAAETQTIRQENPYGLLSEVMMRTQVFRNMFTSTRTQRASVVRPPSTIE